jgi:peptide/nickel transport system substrate-binding protein
MCSADDAGRSYHEVAMYPAKLDQISLTRRAALKRVLASSVLTIVGAACGVAPAPQPATSSTAQAASPAQTLAAGPTSAIPTASTGQTVTVSRTPAAVGGQPRSGGTLRSAVVGDPPGLEVQVLLPSEYETVWLVYDRLIAYDNSLVPQPQLAESWEVNSDSTQIKLNLRKGVQFHSGREFTSDDIKYNLLRVRDPKIGAGTFVNQSSWYSSIDTPDKSTVVLGSDTPRPLTFDFLEYFCIVDRDAMESPDARSKAVGTGPFSLVEWVPGDHLQFARNPNYWLSGRPYLDGVNASILKDAQAMVTQLEANAVDAIKTPPLTDFGRLKDQPGYQGLAHPNAGIFFCFGVNVLNPPMDDKRVRQALNYAIDRKRFTDTVMFGLGNPKALPWLPGSPAYDASLDQSYAFDLDKAKSLLTEAGVTNLTIDLLLTASAEGSSMAQIYQANLAQLGVSLNVRTLDSAVWLDQVNNRKYNGAYWSTATRANLLPGTMLSSSKLSDPNNNNSGFKDDQYSQLVSAATTEPDPEKQKQIYQQMNQLLLDQSFFMTVSTDPPTMLVRANVHDVAPLSFGGFGYTDAWIAQQNS